MTGRIVGTAVASLMTWLLVAGVLWANPIAPFVGSYSGSADLVRADGSTQHRDMSVEIVAAEDDGFVVNWSSVNYRDDGRKKESQYQVEFIPSGREGIYAAAMRRNVFGHVEQLDPMKGEPYVWGRIEGDKLTVFSLYVRADGGYEMQQFDRSLAEDGLMLDFKLVRDGAEQHSVSTLLKRR